MSRNDTDVKRNLRSLVISMLPTSRESKLEWARMLHEMADEVHRLGIESPSERKVKT